MTRHFICIILLCAAHLACAAETYDERSDVLAFVDDMVARHGFDREVLLAQFHRVKPSPPVLKAIQPAEPGKRSWQAYRARFIEPKRVARGLAFWNDNEVALVRAQATYGIPPEIIVSIIGIETIYGQHTGGFDTFNALANLAFDYPPRADLFRQELESLLLLARTESRDPWTFRGSYAGALGLPQFLPSSIRDFAVDFDENGHIDLTHPTDAVGSVARFLYLHGWEPGRRISQPVKLSPGDTGPLLAEALLGEGIFPTRLPTEMSEAIEVPADAPAEAAALIDLPTPDAPTEYRLGYNNFYVITRYNRSSFYASAVQDLADTLKQAWLDPGARTSAPGVSPSPLARPETR